MKSGWFRFGVMLSIAVLSLGAYWTIRLAVADHLFRANSLDALARAVRLASGNARYLAWLAEHQEAAGRDPTQALEQASALNPLDSSLWISRGLRAESDGDYDHAERFLLQAARVDKLFDPRATLANYYFRRDNGAQFWRWMREALAIGYGDLTPLFSLCWRMTNDADAIRARALPPERRVHRLYLSFLLNARRMDAAEPIARRLADSAASMDTAVLIDFVDRSLDRQEPASALAVWNSLCGRKLLPFHPASALTNGDFSFAITSRGFDWRVPASAGISAVRVTPGGLRIDLSGKQPERCELLFQYVPLVPGKSCRFQFSYQTSGFPPDSGLVWRVDNLPAEIPLTSSGDWKQSDWTFQTGRASLARLILEYNRLPGTARLQGAIALRDLKLGCSP